ncbi:YagK/YfjJ domain-containing protein [Colwellia psychrerythraea]|uniref:YagK/YfjJ C-terminal domain-containing protein n=1 Tax=Colwellia psychrerythraea (strain 34H / ATCC BAA-681) TaxID=167879 RepID=Q483L8_COLP3|nr:inovirus-type Gp2 protein [Colwellia psychrerythraea]AAZ25794.1 hypothetical protein CPS_2018 [Colwellia psychrerythraea 34H]
MTSNHKLNQFKYKSHGYNIYSFKESGYNSKALNNIFKLCESMLFAYSKVFLFRIDFHVNEHSPNNQLVSNFLANYIKHLEKIYQCKASYICVREQNISAKQHYHLAFILSGHKVCYPDKITKDCASAWKRHSSGSVHFPKKCYYMIKRGDKRSINPCIYRLSYFVKNHSKNLNGTAKSYLMSRIKNAKLLPECDYLFVEPEVTLKNNQDRNNGLVNEGSEVDDSLTAIRRGQPKSNIAPVIVSDEFVQRYQIKALVNEIINEDFDITIIIFKPP